MIEIEYVDPHEVTCDCCNAASTRLTRFVREDGDAFAVYYAAFSDKHRENGLVGIVSMGDWHIDDPIPESRVAFAFVLWEDEDNYNVTITDAAESLWSDVEILGAEVEPGGGVGPPVDRRRFSYHGSYDEDPAICEVFGEKNVH